jgi:hypothetical protein
MRLSELRRRTIREILKYILLDIVEIVMNRPIQSKDRSNTVRIISVGY